MYPVSLFVEQADNKTRHIKPSKKIFFIIIVPSSETLAVCGITLDALFIPQQKDKKILYAQTTQNQLSNHIHHSKNSFLNSLLRALPMITFNPLQSVIS